MSPPPPHNVPRQASGHSTRPYTSVMTASRRRAPLPLLAVAMLAAVFVWSPPAEALTEAVLVKNTGQSVWMNHTELWPVSFPKRAQRFTTGNNSDGYVLGSIAVRFHNIADTSSAGSELIVTLNADNNGNPAGSALCTLTDPTTFSASGLHTFTAPTTGTDRCPLLAASTNYFVVIQRVAGSTDQISLSLTRNSDEDSGGAANWSIGDANKYFNSSSWNGTSGQSHMIEVKGAVIVPPPRVTGFDLHSDNDNPKGIWGNDEYFWVSQNGSTDKLFAYNRSDGSRASSQDFNTLSGAGNERPTGICSDGTTMFVADFDDTKVYTYDLSTKAHDSTKDINLATANNKPEGVWCDATYVWVVDDDTVSNGNDIFAYNRADGTQNTDVDFTDIDDAGLNANPRDIYSNGTTMFVVDDEDAKVYAWKMSDQTRESNKEISLDSDNADPEGLWFDGRVLWVVDDADDEVYVYDLALGSAIG